MREGFTQPQEAISSVESFSDWRALERAAPQTAAEKISEIEGFNEMHPADQVRALNKLFADLEVESNDMRFVAKIVSAKRQDIEDEMLKKKHHSFPPAIQQQLAG